MEQHDIGKVASIYTFIQSVRMLVDMAIRGNVFQNILASSLQHVGFLAGITRDAERFISKLRVMDENSLGHAEIIYAYVEGFNAVFLVITAISSASLLTSIIFKTCKRRCTLSSRQKNI